MSSFEDAEVHEDGKEVHVGRVELQVDGGGTDVVAGGHHPDHGEGEAHRVEQAVVKNHSFVLNLILSLFKFKELLHSDDFDVKKTKEKVAYVAQEMVAHDQSTSRLQAPKVVEATVLISVIPWKVRDVTMSKDGHNQV